MTLRSLWNGPWVTTEMATLLGEKSRTRPALAKLYERGRADLPGVPVLISPADGATLYTRQVTLSWEAGEGAPPEGYEVEVDGIVLDATGTSLDVSLEPGTHTWRVRAYTSAGFSEFSSAWSFDIRALIYLPVVIR